MGLSVGHGKRGGHPSPPQSNEMGAQERAQFVRAYHSLAKEKGGEKGSTKDAGLDVTISRALVTDVGNRRVERRWWLAPMSWSMDAVRPGPFAGEKKGRAAVNIFADLQEIRPGTTMPRRGPAIKKPGRFSRDGPSAILVYCERKSVPV